ncbi:MAG: metalloregulator ArsR/SmtB family transcription factor [Deltaproteobacteria bacterium]|nr:metalloregulator ArsR/SmtB family transcription factor [Deltaproteobacteria bacterium]
MEETLRITKALADGNRLRAVMSLVNHDELCVCQITELLNLATATVSRHMSVLQGGRLVASRKKGRWVYYSLSETFPKDLLVWLKEALADSGVLAADREKLKEILALDPDELCRNQRKRCASGPSTRERGKK